MRLLRLDGDDLSINQFSDVDFPSYAILSHMWGPEEVRYEDIVGGTWMEKRAHEKILFYVKQAAADGLGYFWVDSCCIDTSNNAELQEAINSTFQWFKNAAICYVHLIDVPASQYPTTDGRFEPVSDFERSKWFQRCWTLQELLAPRHIDFFAANFERLGNKKDLEQQIHNITGIPVEALRGKPLSHFSFDERCSWAAKRVSTHPEDFAYSLLGIFGVYLPMIWGEGRENAIRRLKNELGVWKASQNPSQLQPRYGDLGEGRFRILIIDPGIEGSKISGFITEQDFLQAPEYNALSYTWGTEPPIHRVDLNYEACYVPPNLFHALQRMRSPIRHTFLWVDYLCINQANTSEKSRQVGRMGDIYEKAKNVWIWLGEEGWKSKSALDFVPQISRLTFQWGSSWWKRDEFVALNRVLERPWFRRCWVIQEAASSANSIIYCGDRQVKMDDFARAVKAIRHKLRSVPTAVNTKDGFSNDLLDNFRDSPATRLLDIISAAVRKPAFGRMLKSNRQLSLETLVDLSSFCESQRPQDSIFSLLGLANDLEDHSSPRATGSITPDYNMSLLDVFAQFTLHCCRTGSLDIICRPWVPLLSSGEYTADELDQFQEVRMCSWLVTRDNLPLRDLNGGVARRQYAKPLVGRSQKRVYNAHNGTAPQARLGMIGTATTCDGSLHAKGVVLGEIVQRSMRMANGLVTSECLDILLANEDRQPSLSGLSDTVWRTLCADRDSQGLPVPAKYRSRIIEMLRLNPDSVPNTTKGNKIDTASGFDIEELLAINLPEGVKEVVTVIGDVVWNRRTFRGKRNEGSGDLVGIIPRYAAVGDQLCILYGCSVPVVLRKRSSTNNRFHWQLVGEAYVHGFMDGKGISSLSPTMLERAEVEFEIR